MGQDTQATDQATQASDSGMQITGKVPLYRKPEPLNYGMHGKLGITRNPAAGLEFMKGTNYCLVVATEFFLLSRTYPIIFVGEEHAPVAIMGLRDGENAFVRPDGTFEPNAYAPAFLRRYPFVLANNPAGDGQSIVCIDRAYELLSENAENPFFIDGQPSEETRRAIDFLNMFENDRRATMEMVEFFKELDLFTDMGASYNETPVGNEPPRSTLIATYRGIPVEKMQELDAKKLVALRDRGYLPSIYAHQISLQNWPGLVNRSAERGWLKGSPLEHIQDMYEQGKKADAALRGAAS